MHSVLSRLSFDHSTPELRTCIDNDLPRQQINVSSEHVSALKSSGMKLQVDLSKYDKKLKELETQEDYTKKAYLI
jgi:hypothetical protein